MEHPLNKMDRFLNLNEGVTRSVIALHQTEHFHVLRVKLLEHGINLLPNTSIPKKYRPNWAKIAKEAGLPPEWCMEGDNPQDVISSL